MSILVRTQSLPAPKLSKLFAGKAFIYTAEAYYKWQPFNHVLIVGGLQYIANPAYNFDENSLWLGSIKFRMTF